MMRKFVEEAIHNARLEGFDPKPEHLCEWEKCIQGHQTLEETVKKLQTI